MRSHDVWVKLTWFGCACALVIGAGACGGARTPAAPPAAQQAPRTTTIRVTLESPLSELPLGDGPIEVRLLPQDVRARWTKSAPAEFEVRDPDGSLTVNVEGDYLHDGTKITGRTEGRYATRVVVLPRVAPLEVEKASGTRPVLYVASAADGSDASYRLVSIEHGSIARDSTVPASGLDAALKESIGAQPGDPPLQVVLLHKAGARVDEVTPVLRRLVRPGISLALAEESKANLAQRPILAGVLTVGGSGYIDVNDLDSGSTGSAFDSPAPEETEQTLRIAALSVRGPLDANKARRVIAGGGSKFSQCLAIGRHRSPKLAGNVRLEVEVAKDGSVLGAKNDGSTVSDREFVGCIASIFYGLVFAAPGAPSTMDVQLLLPPI